MRKSEVLKKLKDHKTDLESFRIQRLAVFGSVARGEAKDTSDIDILVEFEPGARIGLLEFVRLQRVLGDLLGSRVDLVTPNALREEMKSEILEEAVDAS